LKIRISVKWLAFLLLLPMTVFSVIFGLYPLGYTVFLSLTPFAVGASIISFAGLTNYIGVLKDSFYINSLVSTFLIVGGAVAIELLFGLGLALLLREGFRGSRLIRVALLAPLMTPPIVAGTVWKTLLFPSTSPLAGLFSSVGLVFPNMLATVFDARIAVIFMDVWQYTPFVMLIILAGLQTIPTPILEAAKVDGARSFSMLREITLPLIVPIIIVAAVFRLLTAAKLFDTVYVLTQGGPSFGTDVVSLFVQRTFVFSYELSYASAGAVIFMVFMFVVAFALTKVMRRTMK
jgi:multiple sugar transport system permease protein